MKDNWLSKIDLLILVIVGLLASVISFVYYFVMKNPYEILLWMIYIIDFVLFLASAYRAISVFDLSKAKTIFFTIVTMIGFFAFCEIVVFVFTCDTSIKHTMELFFNVFRVSWFLSPSFILLIPVIWFIGEVMA